MARPASKAFSLRRKTHEMAEMCALPGFSFFITYFGVLTRITQCSPHILRYGALQLITF